MSLSVCMATLGRPDRLAAFFRSFDGVRLPVPCEVILVLNTARPPDLAGLLPAQPAYALRTLIEPVPGKSRALNRALDAAQGELLVFTDDDVEFDPAWLERLWSAAREHSQVPVFGGAVRTRGEVPDWIRRSVNLQGILLSEHVLGDAPLRYGGGRYPFGPNLAVRRSAVLGAHARWREDVGPGTRLPVGDEGEFLAQISPPHAPDRLYVPDAVVWHHVERGYFGLATAARRTFQNGLAAGRISAAYGSAPNPRSVAAQSVDRLRQIASAQELVCNVTRALGYFIGRYLWRGAASPPPAAGARAR
jgi:hypothetical protein